MTHSKRNLLIQVLVLAAFYGIGQALFVTGTISSYVFNTLVVIGYNIILAVSLNLVTGFTGQFSLGHAGFMAIGAYSTALIASAAADLGSDLFTNHPLLVFLLSVLVGGIFASILGFLIGLPTLRLKGDYLAIATLGMAEIIRVLLLNFKFTNGAAGLQISMQFVDWNVLFIFVVGTIILIKNFLHSRHGHSCIAVREDEIAAESIGIYSTRIKTLAFVIGAFFGSVGGSIYAGNFFFVKPDIFNFMMSINILVVVVLGGLGSLTGSVLAAILLPLVSTLLQPFPEIRMILYSLVLVVLMVFRPQGLLGNQELSLKLFDRILPKRLRRSDTPAQTAEETAGGKASGATEVDASPRPEGSENSADTPEDALLDVHKLTRHFGGLMAVTDVNMYLQPGELIGLIGPNGAGKTTVFNLLTGVYPPSSGTMDLKIEDRVVSLGGKKPYAISHAGVARTFQNIRLFKDLTVLDNVVYAMEQGETYPLIASLLHLPSWSRSKQRMHDESMKLLQMMHLEDKADELARNLSYGDQRHLEIARALATSPKLLLLDEPAAGMNPAETAQLTDLIAFIRKEYGLTILLIEHDMSLVMKICERIYVLDHGVVIASGTPDEVRNNPKVIEAYLGEEVEDV